MGLKEDLAAATVKNAKGVEIGINVVKKDGTLVLARPDSVRLASSVERGIYIDGLKEGDRLAHPSEVAVAAALARKKNVTEDELGALKARRAAGAPKPAKPATPAS